MDESEYGRVRNLLNGECEGLTTAGGVPTQPKSGPTPPTTIDTTATTEASGLVGGQDHQHRLRRSRQRR